MVRQSISLNARNDEWLKAQIENQEYASKSEAVNDLIRKARMLTEEREFVKEKLRRAEESGFTKMSAEHIRQKAQDALKADGLL